MVEHRDERLRTRWRGFPGERLRAHREGGTIRLVAHPDVLAAIRESPGITAVALIEDTALRPDAYDVRPVRGGDEGLPGS